VQRLLGVASNLLVSELSKVVLFFFELLRTVRLVVSSFEMTFDLLLLLCKQLVLDSYALGGASILVR
jgi:hypothetical protein